MKITILGRGNAGCLTALYFADRARYEEEKIDIELIYDKNILPEKVGQGTLLDPPKLLWSALGIDWYNNPIDATPKAGILYENWGKTREKSFASPFPLDRIALHYSPEKLQDTILNSKLFDVTERHIENYDEIDSDYIFDCRGRPKSAEMWDDYEELRNPLNAVLLGQSKKRDMNQLWTRAVATPDGWTFVIPNTSNTTSYGYLYNDNITSEKEAENNFRKYLDVEDIQTFESSKFKKYLAKNPVVNDRIILNGNALFFIEPLEATAIGTYLNWANKIWNSIVAKKHNLKDASTHIKQYIHEIETFILWHYQFGSKYDTPFWDFAKTFEINDERFSYISEYAITTNETKLRQTYHAGMQYGQWQPWNFKFWYNAVV